MTSDHIIATINLDSIVIFDIIVAFDALLTSSPVTWREKRLWNFSVLQTVHLFGLLRVLGTVTYGFNPHAPNACNVMEKKGILTFF
jgi:hypothetical protein